VLATYLLVALTVQAEGDCPGARDVERELGRLLGEESAARDVATIAGGVDGAVSLALADASGQPIGARTLPRARTCSEQAKAVAVTLAIWEAQLHPEISLGLDRLPSDQPSRPLSSTEATPVARVAAPPPPPTSAAARELTSGLAALGDFQSSGWAPGGRLELGVGPTSGSGGRWRARLAVVGVGPHSIELPPGRVSWWRAFAQLGADYDVARGRHWAGVLGAGALGGVVSIAGAGFPVDRTSRSLDLGVEGRVRTELRLGRKGQVRPWVGATVAMWVRRQGLDIQGTTTDAALPRTEPMVLSGADFAW